MKKTQTTLFDTAERLNREKHTGKAIRELQRIRSSGTITTAEEEARCFYLMSTYLQKQHKHEQALVEAEAGVRLSMTLDDYSIFADLKYRLGSVLIDLGHLDRALGELEDALAFYRKMEDQKNVALTLNLISNLYFMKGNLKQSYLFLRSAFDQSREHSSDKNHVTAIANNMCRVALLQGNFRSFKKVLAEADFSGVNVDRVLHNRLIQAFASILELDFVSANVHLEAFETLSAGNRFPDLEIVHDEYTGLLEYCRGNYKQANEYFQRVLSREHLPPSAEAQTLRMMTDLYIAMQQFKSAETTAKKAEVVITKIPEQVELGALWRAYGQIYFHDGLHEKAKEYFEKSIYCLSECGANYELALTHFIIGQTELMDYVERLHHLVTSRELFASMEVSARFRQAEEAISVLETRFINTKRQSLTGVQHLDEVLEDISGAFREKSFSDTREALRTGRLKQEKLLKFVERAIYKDSPITKDMIATFTGVPPELVEEYVDSLEKAGRVKSEEYDGYRWYSGNSLIRRLIYAR